VIALAMLLANTPVAKEGVYEWCKAPEESIKGLACTTFVTGVIGGAMEASRMQGTPTPTPFCIPSAVTQRGKETIVVAYLEKHPEFKGRDSAGIVVAAIHDAFPCGRR